MRLVTSALLALALAFAGSAAADQTAQAGSAAGASAGAGAQAQTGNTSVVVDQSGNVNHGSDFPAASAAAVFVGNCQTGGSGQTEHGGLSTVFDSSQCQALRQATAEQQLYEFYMAKGDKATAELHLERMEHYMAQAADAVDYGMPTKTVGGWFLDLIPVGVIAFLL